jgi:single-strand DNA-binding protein
MAQSVNRATILGNVGRDPEMRYTSNGQAITQFSVATSRSFKRNDEWQEETDWHAIVVFGERAERAAEHVRKGKQVYIEGRIQTRSWDDDETGKKRYKTEIVADKVFVLGRREDQDSSSSEFVAPVEGFGPPEAVASTPSASPRRVDDYDDLPF